MGQCSQSIYQGRAIQRRVQDSISTHPFIVWKPCLRLCYWL